MRSQSIRLVYVGNLNSVLFRQRVAHMQKLLGDSAHTILDTGRRSSQDQVRFLLTGASLILKICFSFRPTRLVLHGAYSPLLWPLLLLRRVRTVSILQGSELNVDFTGIRAHLITLILQRSFLIACRNEAQRDEAVRLCGVRRERCVIVNWGLKQELFDHPLPAQSLKPVFISPRATQSEYNIPIIFEVVSRLKSEGHRLRFVYVRFNPKFALSDTSAADEIFDAPAQEKLWDNIAAADLCISVPEYDGLSNTVVEALALGSLPVYSDLAPYAFLKQDARLGIAVKFGRSAQENAEQLYVALKYALTRIETIRSEVGFRRAFAEKHFKAGSGVDNIIEALSG